jgi:hypothetical protein
VTFAIQGLLLVEHYGKWDFEYEGQNGAFYLRHVVPFVEWLAAEVVNKIQAQSSLTQSDLWENGIYLLYIAARLQGRAGENDSLPDSINAKFDTYNWDNAASKPYASSWEELCKAFGRKHETLVDLMKTASNCAKSSGTASILNADREQYVPLRSKFSPGRGHDT